MPANLTIGSTSVSLKIGNVYGFLATQLRRDKQKGKTVNKIHLMITRQKRPFAERSGSDLSA
jgi:hypothetical protein